MGNAISEVTPERIGGRIVLVRGEKVLLDSDLAALYAVSTKRLNEQVRRNRRRFPSDFVFALTDQELARLRSQNATSNERPGRGGRRYAPYAFTEHGALMAANVLSSGRAIEVSVFVVRAFIRLRETLAADTRTQFKEVIEALRRLMSQPEPTRRPIGFIRSP